MNTPTNAAPLEQATLTHLQQWQGRTETAHDAIAAAPLRGLAATLDRDDAPPATGTPVPPLGHWLYFLPHTRQSALGPDGHARRGGFLPPVPLPRRMWAGGRLWWQTDNPLTVGDEAEKRSRIARITHKRGRSGDLLFVLVRHEVHNARGLCLTEEHDIVYCAAAAPGQEAAAPVPAPTSAPWQRCITPDDVLLFRYSALTFNGHRIHYDRRYVSEVEGYPGLVVHGPLMATLLTDLVRRHAPERKLSRFAFKAVRPVFDGQPLTLSGQPQAEAEGNDSGSGGGYIRLWAADYQGWLTMQAEAWMAE